MNIDAKFLKKYLETKFNNTLAKAHTRVKFQGDNDASTHTNERLTTTHK
jgi:hypothetical protein